MEETERNVWVYPLQKKFHRNYLKLRGKEEYQKETARGLEVGSKESVTTLLYNM